MTLPGRITVTEGATRRDTSGSHPAQDANGYALCAEETYDPPTRPLDENGQGIPYAVYGYGAQLVELSVDRGLAPERADRITAPTTLAA